MMHMITENQRGLLFRNGHFMGVVNPGRLWISGKTHLDILPLDAPVESTYADAATLAANPQLSAVTVALSVGDGQMAFHTVDGRLAHVLAPGLHLFWKDAGQHGFRVEDVTQPDVPADIPVTWLRKAAENDLLWADVPAWHTGGLFVDGKLLRLLEPGRYPFWNTGADIQVHTEDTRPQQLEMRGQELLTRDKVPLRISFFCTYRILDVAEAWASAGDFKEQLYTVGQLALREAVSGVSFDDLLEHKDNAARYVGEAMQREAGQLCLEVLKAGIRDIILPGEIRQIMNTVLSAEKQAQANLITRREEVASTRSLLNTARMMDENQTLYRLKELETLERICRNAGSIEIGGLLDKLTAAPGEIR